MPSKLMHRLSPGEFRRAAEGAHRDPTTMARATSTSSRPAPPSGWSTSSYEPEARRA